MCACAEVQRPRNPGVLVKQQDSPKLSTGPFTSAVGGGSGLVRTEEGYRNGLSSQSLLAFTLSCQPETGIIAYAHKPR